ncbi:Intermediate filament protein, partial [Borealophlyctis nickersoniae]
MGRLEFLTLSLFVYPHVSTILPILASLGFASILLLVVGVYLYVLPKKDGKTKRPKYPVTSIQFDSVAARQLKLKAGIANTASWKPGGEQPPVPPPRRSRVWTLGKVSLDSTSVVSSTPSGSSGGSSGVSSTGGTLEEAIANILLEVVRKEFSEPLFARVAGPHTQPGLSSGGGGGDASASILEQSFSKSVIGPKIAHFAAVAASWIQEQRQLHVEQRLWVLVLSTIHQHIRVYKRVRREVLREYSAKLSAKADAVGPELSRSQEHLDDFNEFAEDDYEGSGNQSWEEPGQGASDTVVDTFPGSIAALRNNVEELNALILLRMMTSGLLHPALKNGADGERAHLRTVMDQVCGVLGMLDGGAMKEGSTRGAGSGDKDNLFQTSNLMRILIREWVVCQLVWPLMDRFCQPDVLNLRLLEKAQKRAMMQKTIRAFRAFVDSHFSNFPPVFVQRSPTAAAIPTTTMSDKFRFFEPLSKYSRKVRSLVDAKAVRHQLVSEMRRRLDEAKDLQYFEELYGESVDTLKRYVKSLDVLRSKFDKRIVALAETETKSLEKSNKRNSASMLMLSPGMMEDKTNSKYDQLTLRKMMDDYIDSADKGTESSTSLYYFFDYLEKRGDKNSIAKVRFWLAAEKYRKLVWRLMNGIYTRDTFGGPSDHTLDPEGEAIGTDERLQKEAAKIHRSFLVAPPGGHPAVDLGNDILVSAIEEFATNGSSSSDSSQEYKCILVAQDMVHRELQEEFSSFLHSESYFRWASEFQKKKLSEVEGIATGAGEPPLTLTRRSMDGLRRTGEGLSAGGLSKRSSWDLGISDSMNRTEGSGMDGSMEGLETDVRQSFLLTSLLQELEATGEFSAVHSGSKECQSDKDAIDRNAAVRLTGAKPKRPRLHQTTGRRFLNRQKNHDTDSDSGKGGPTAWASVPVLGSETLPVAPDDIDIIFKDTEDVAEQQQQRKDWTMDEDPEFHAPGELLVNTTKLQQLKEETDKVLLQIDCINILNSLVLSENGGKGGGGPVSVVEAYILEQTKELLRQEVGDLTRQKAKYQSQEQKDAIVPGQCTVKIEAAFDDVVRQGVDGPGKKVTFYLIRIDKEVDMSGWTVRRRYSDFHALHRKLKERFPIVNEFELPGKTLGLWPRGKRELKAVRMQSLEKYLQRLMDDPSICQSDELRTFLSSSHGTLRSTFFPSIYNASETPDAKSDKSAASKYKRTSQRFAKFMSQAGRRGANQKGDDS